MLDEVEVGTSVRLGQIRADSDFYRHFAILPSLQSLSRDAVLVSLITNNPRERRVTTLVNRLGGCIGFCKEILWVALLSGSFYSFAKEFSLKFGFSS